MLKIEELRQLNLDEASEKVLSLKKELLSLRIAQRIGKLEKNHRFREIKKDIARLLTVSTELARGEKAAVKPKPVKKIEEKKNVAKKEPVKTEEAPKKRGFFGRLKKG